MRKQFSKIVSLAALWLALTFTLSCSGDDGDEGGGGGGSCSLETLDGVWEADFGSITISDNKCVISALPSGRDNPYKVGDQTCRGLTSTGNLTWSGQEHIMYADPEWSDIQLTMSADGKKLTILSLDGETITLTRKCNNQSGGGSSSSVKGGSSPSGGGLTGTSGTITDSRDSKPYKWVKIGVQYWLAENVNYDVPDNDTDVCNDNEPANCTTYGRLYNWETANTACPNGWRLPSNEDWDILITTVGGSETAGKYLKAKSGWNENGNGEDKFGFSALPGGYRDENLHGVGTAGRYWSSTKFEGLIGYYHMLEISGEMVFVGIVALPSEFLLSVRCVKDN